MSDAAPPCDVQLVSAPISIHGLEPADVRRLFVHRVAWPTGVGIAITGVWLLVPGAFYGYGSAGYEGLLIGSAVGAAAFLPLMYVAYRFWFRPVILGTTYELWPDRIVSRILGRPPLVIRRDEVASVRVTPWVGRHMVVENHHGECMSIPWCVRGFEQLAETLKGWTPTAEAGRQLRRRQNWRAMRWLMVATVALFSVAPTNPIWGTAALPVVAAAFAWQAWEGCRREHLDKISRIFFLLACAALPLIMTGFVALRWGQWLRSPKP